MPPTKEVAKLMKRNNCFKIIYFDLDTYISNKTFLFKF